MAKRDHLSAFRNEVGLTSIAPEAVVSVVFASSRVSDRWKEILEHTYGTIRLGTECTDLINESRKQVREDGIDTDLWRQMTVDLDASGLRDLDADVLRRSSADMDAFFGILEENSGTKKTPDALTAAKAYLAVYQKQWTDILVSVLRGVRYDTRKKVEKFVDERPSMNWDTLCTIFSGMAKST